MADPLAPASLEWHSLQHLSAPGRPLSSAPSPHPPSLPPTTVLFSIGCPCTPVPLALIFPLPQPHSQLPHLKQVQRRPGRRGVTAPTGTGQQAYSSGTGSSGSRWSPRGPHPGGGRMEELEGLGEGRQVKHTHQGTRSSPSPSHTGTLGHSAPPLAFSLSLLGERPA